MYVIAARILYPYFRATVQCYDSLLPTAPGLIGYDVQLFKVSRLSINEREIGVLLDRTPLIRFSLSKVN